MNRNEAARPAGIEYVGQPGISKECKDAVLRLLQFGDRVTHVRILSSSNYHCLLLRLNVGYLVAVKSGFSSGYLGEGSRTFSYVLELLDAHGADIEEYIVPAEVIGRLDSSSLTAGDLNTLDAAKPVRPLRWPHYVFEDDEDQKDAGTLWQEFPPVIPFAVIDSRIVDLALSFWDEPDQKLLVGYRRLEEIVRKRTAIDGHGAKLFSRAFAPNDGRLAWKDINGGEHAGRMELFTSAYMAYRNRRAHRESSDSAETLLTEFLLLNHLYRLEKDSIDATSTHSRHSVERTGG